MKERKETIILAMSYEPCKEFLTWGTPKFIPKGTIKEIKKLK